MNNIIIYVANDIFISDEIDVNAYSIEAEEPEVINEVIRVAREQETVYDLRQFEWALNIEDFMPTNSWVVIRNKNVKI
jgi:hypothetical protein